jgi:hypothetical protein
MSWNSVQLNRGEKRRLPIIGLPTILPTPIPSAGKAKIADYGHTNDFTNTLYD